MREYPYTNAVGETTTRRAALPYYPSRLLAAAERALSPVEALKEFKVLHSYGANPYREGRERQERRWMDFWQEGALRLVWC